MFNTGGETRTAAPSSEEWILLAREVIRSGFDRHFESGSSK